MFYSLTGDVIAYDTTSVAINCGGVGFKCYTTTNTLKHVAAIGDKITVLTYLSVKEDALELYGFYTQSELDCFKLLITVSGVGPKAALAVLSFMSPDSLALCIASGDVNSIKKAPGIGPKIAQRIILELKNKLVPENYSSDGASSDFLTDTPTGSTAEAISALVVLGYSTADASKVVAKAPKDMSTEALIKYALRQLAKGV